MTVSKAILFVSVSVFSLPALADPVRTDVPIKLDISPNKLDYSIAVRYGSTTVQTLLDTGSIKAQVLPGQLQPGDAQDTGQAYSETYQARAYNGTVFNGPVTIGAASATASFGIPNAVHCTNTNPNCPVANGNPQTATFGGAQYHAIVGAKVAPTASTELFATLSPRFIITAPRNGENNNTGDLLLNPTAADVNGFTPLRPFDPSIGAPPSAVYGCLRDLDAGKYFCGGIVPDTGVTGILVFPANANTGQAFQSGDSARIEFTDAQYARVAGVDFTIGQNSASTITIEAAGQYSLPVIKVGQMPYLGLRVLTDLQQSIISVSPRAAGRAGIFGHVP